MDLHDPAEGREEGGGWGRSFLVIFWRGTGQGQAVRNLTNAFENRNYSEIRSAEVFGRADDDKNLRL